jgi:hypothetical protein
MKDKFYKQFNEIESLVNKLSYDIGQEAYVREDEYLHEYRKNAMEAMRNGLQYMYACLKTNELI